MTDLLRRTRWLWITLFVAILVAEAFAAHTWAVRQSKVPAKDCAVVEQLGRQWVATIAYVNRDTVGSARDLAETVAIEGALSDRIRAAQDEVTDSRIKSNLKLWADAAAETAELQRSVLASPPQAFSQESDDADTAEQLRIAKKTFWAIQPLRESCPNAQFQ